MTEQEYLYWLLHIQGIGAVTAQRLYGRFGSFQAVWEAKEKELAASGILTPRRLAALCAGKGELDNYRRGYERLCAEGIRFVPFFDPQYPERLIPYPDKPAALFVRGSLPDKDRPSAAVVGARDCTEYGRQTAEDLSAALAGEGVQIISGFALGIDGAAHRGALAAGGETFGILGCGIDICYPRENYRLLRSMERQGGLITEFVPKTRPEPGNFPQRNRIISGLADAVIVVEAREKSGSLITADLALEQGKEVFAFPGRATDPLSAGCNRLLQSGAALCLGPSEVLEYFGMKFEKKLTVRKISEKRLAKKENLLYSFLDSRPRHLEEIMKDSGLSLRECMDGLLKLELFGLAYGTGNQYYCRKL